MHRSTPISNGAIAGTPGGATQTPEAAASPAFSALLDDFPVCLFQVDRARRVLYMNKAARDWYRLDRHEVPGRHLQDIMGAQTYGGLMPHLDRVLTGVGVTAELPIGKPDQSTRWSSCRLVPQIDAEGTVRGFVMTLLDISEQKQAEQRQQQFERQLRATLMREVHHRMKNSLQGIIGLMRMQSSRYAGGPEYTDAAVAQLTAISVAFGLAGRHTMSKILLCDLVQENVRNVAECLHNPIQLQFSAAAERQPVALDETCGANISLIINELLFNAVKHGRRGERQAVVSVMVDRDSSSATVTIANDPGTLPEPFSIEEKIGLGTGLCLAKTLLPAEAGKLSLQSTGTGVIARLHLTAPAICLEALALI